MEVCKRGTQLFESNLPSVQASFGGVMTPTASAGNLNIAFNAAIQNQVKYFRCYGELVLIFFMLQLVGY